MSLSRICSLLGIGCGVLGLWMLVSCGLDTFYYLDPPTSVHFIDEAASGSSNDAPNHYVSFVTALNPENAGVYQGTSVYYKIFNSAYRLVADKTSIENIPAESSSQGITRLISWGYQALSTAQLTTANLVLASQGVSEVGIRLYNETPNPDGSGFLYPADVTIDSTSIGVPLRSVENKTFSFDANAQPDSPDSVPTEGQEDVTFTSGSTTSTWYVALYAVSTGMSPSLTPVYSQVTYLGSLAITPTSN